MRAAEIASRAHVELIGDVIEEALVEAKAALASLEKERIKKALENLTAKRDLRPPKKYGLIPL